MEQTRRVLSVPARGIAPTDHVDVNVREESAALRAEAVALLERASRLLGLHPDEIEAARACLPETLKDYEAGGWVPSHVAVRLLRRIEGLAGMATLADVLERSPDLREELQRRASEHSNRMRDVAKLSPRSKSFKTDRIF